MRRLIQTSAVALVAAAAWTFGGCTTNDGESFRRAPDQTSQVQRPDELRHDRMPMNVGGAGGAGSDPGQIQGGATKPLGIPQTGGQLTGAAGGAQGANDANSDENVQGQGNAKPGVTSETLPIPQQKQPPSGESSTR